MCVEMELEGCGGTCRLQRIVRGDSTAQGLERVVEASVVHGIRLGHERRDLFEDREDTLFLTLSVVAQDFVEEPEALHCRFESRRTASRGRGGLVDSSHVRSERVVYRE